MGVLLECFQIEDGDLISNQLMALLSDPFSVRSLMWFSLS